MTSIRIKLNRWLGFLGTHTVLVVAMFVARTGRVVIVR